MTISSHDKSPRTSRWYVSTLLSQSIRKCRLTCSLLLSRLLPNMRNMVEREMEDREAVRALDPAPEEKHEPEDREEEEYQCEYCKTLCYLSQVLSEDGTHIACPEHATSLPPGPKIFRTRIEDADLLQLVNRVRSRAEKAGRYPDPQTGFLDGYDHPRTSGRKRKPSMALLEAAGRDGSPASQRQKTAKSEEREDESFSQDQPSYSEEPNGDIQLDEGGDIAVGGGGGSAAGDDENDLSLNVMPGGYTAPSRNGAYGGSSMYSQPPQDVASNGNAGGDLFVGFSPPKPRTAVYN